MTRRIQTAACVVTTLLFAGSVVAQSPEAPVVETPSLGFAIDPLTHILYSMPGVPGAALFMPVADWDPSLVPQAASSRGNYALVLSGQAGTPAIWTPQSPLLPLAGVTSAPDRVALSPEGTAAALYYRRENRVETVAGLPGAPVRVATVSRAGQGDLTQFAVSDDGKLVLCAAASDAGSIVVLGLSAEVNRLRIAGTPRAAAFAGGSHDAVIAGDSGATLFRTVDSPTGTAHLFAQGLGPVSAVAVSADASEVLLASAQTSKVAIIALNSGSGNATVLDCGCSPAELDRIGGGSVFRLTPYSSGVAWIVDASTGTPRILSVPNALAAATQTNGNQQ
jgi:hypothetical protein